MKREHHDRLRVAALAYLEAVQRQTGLTDSALARRAGIASSTISRPKRDPDFAVTLKTLLAIQEATGVPLPVTITQSGLENGSSSIQADPRSAPPVQSPMTLNGLPGATPSPFGARDLPVLGRAQGGVGVVKIASDEQPIDWTFRPAELVGVASAYAVYVVDDSLSPIYEHGDLVYVHPGWPVRVGKVVVVQLDDDSAIIKVFVSQSDKEVRVRSADPKQANLVYPRARVRAIHRVIGGIESR